MASREYFDVPYRLPRFTYFRKINPAQAIKPSTYAGVTLTFTSHTFNSFFSLISDVGNHPSRFGYVAIKKTRSPRDRVPAVLLAEWNRTREMVGGDVVSGPVPTLFSNELEAAKTLANDPE